MFRRIFLLILAFLSQGCNRSGSAPETRTPVFYLYTGDAVNLKIYGYKINLTTGTLTANPGSPYLITPGYLSVDSARNLILIAQPGPKVQIVSANPSSGDLVALSPSTTVTGSTSSPAVLDPNFQTFYLINGSTLYSYSYGGGAVGTVGSQSTYNNTQYLGLDIFGRFLFSTLGTSAASSLVFGVSGSLGNPTVSAVTSCNTGSIPSMDATGQYLFYNDGNGGAICIMSINQTTGALTQVSSFVPPSGESDQIVTDTINNVLASNDTTNHVITAYKFVNNGASFTQLASTAAGNFMALDPAGKFLYTTAAAGGSITAYSISPGAITQIQNFNFAPSGALPPYVLKLYK